MALPASRIALILHPVKDFIPMFSICAHMQAGDA
jgi:hypothetical protein